MLARSIQQELAADFVGQGGDVGAHPAQELAQADVEHAVDARVAQPGVQFAGQAVGLAARAVGIGQLAAC